MFWFPSAYKSYLSTILSTQWAIVALHLKKCTYLDLKIQNKVNKKDLLYSREIDSVSCNNL